MAQPVAAAERIYNLSMQRIMAGPITYGTNGHTETVGERLDKMRSLGVEYDQQFEKEHRCGANRFDLEDQEQALRQVKDKLKYHQANLKKIWTKKLQTISKQESPGPASYQALDFTSSTITKGKLSADSSHIGYRWGTAPKYRPDISLEERKMA